MGLFNFAFAAAFGEGFGGDGAAHTILDGDGFHCGGVAQGEGFAVERAFSGGRAAIGGVAELSFGGAAEGYLGGFLKGGGSADGGGFYGGGIGRFGRIGGVGGIRAAVATVAAARG